MKLHELIAAEEDRRTVANSVITETIATFTKKAELFNGQIRSVRMFEEHREHENLDDYSPVIETVDGKLDHTWNKLRRVIDLEGMKCQANREAIADVVVNEIVIIRMRPQRFCCR